MPAQCVISKDSRIYNHTAQVGALHRGETRQDLVHVPYSLHAKRMHGSIKDFMNKQYIQHMPKETTTARKVRV
jgi:hypothetical protein